MTAAGSVRRRCVSDTTFGNFGASMSYGESNSISYSGEI